MNTATPTKAPGLSAGEKICWSLVLVGGAATAAPFVAPATFAGWNGGQFAMAMVGLLVGLTAFISVFLFRRRRRVRDRLFDEGRLLVHWRYEAAEWRRFAEEDFLRDRRMKWALYWVLTVISLVVGGFFFAMDPRRGGPVVLVVLAGLCLFIALLIAVTTRVQRRHRVERGGEVRIGTEGLWMSGELHVWQGWGARFEGCEVGEGTPPFVAFTYSTPAKGQRQINTVRVPIPTGYEAEAAGVVERFRALATKA